ncbi:MAG: glutamate synthase subunit beta [Kiritimatiellaeota bacterium]|nr:glutamate synthase subunit beta [Kiritimatiellota bacterium]
MSNPRAFMEIKRSEPAYRLVEERTKDFREVEIHPHTDSRAVEEQAERCMDCGIPFCHGTGCPLCNVIPEFNEFVANERYEDALRILLSTNEFPEFTGRVCPAPCEAACTAGLNDAPVDIRRIELAVAEIGFENEWMGEPRPFTRTGRKVAVVGSGPSGLAIANKLNRLGHSVTVFERSETPGGLLRYGIPDFKLDKEVVKRRINLMSEEGVVFECGVSVGIDLSLNLLRRKFDAVCLCGGAGIPRDLQVPGRELRGIHFAMDFLSLQNKLVAGEKTEVDISAAGKNVVVIGGGDTGSDCVGTSIRQGARSVTQIEIMPKPPESRSEHTPWPRWPYQLRTSSSHKEGCERLWSMASKSFEGKNGNVSALKAVKVEWKSNELGMPAEFAEIPDGEFSLEADLVLLAMGFIGPADRDAYESIGLEFSKRGGVATDGKGETNIPGVFAAGDIATGPSLVVRAMAAGANLADSVAARLASI